MASLNHREVCVCRISDTSHTLACGVMRIVPDRSATLLPVIQVSMRPCGGNVIEVPLPQLWQVCVRTLLSGTLFQIPRCTICWPTCPTVFVFVFSTGFFKHHQLLKTVTWYRQQVNIWLTWHVTQHVRVACRTCMASGLCSVLSLSSKIIWLASFPKLPNVHFWLLVVFENKQR